MVSREHTRGYGKGGVPHELICVMAADRHKPEVYALCKIR